MLGGVRLQVTYTHEKSCFAYLNSKYSTNNEQGQSIQVMYKDKQLVLWAVFSSAAPEGRVGLHPALARLLGLPEGAEVFAAPRPGLPELDELHIDTDSPDDQEILENNAEILQLRILDQLRVVVAEQKCVVWAAASLPVVFTPRRSGLLVARSRLVVRVDAFRPLRGPPQAPAPTDKDKGFNNIGVINQGMLRPYLNPPKKLYLRSLPIDSDGKRNLIHPYIVFMHEDLLEAKYKDGPIILATMKSIPPLIDDAKDDDEAAADDREINDLCVEIVPIDNIVFRSLCHEVYNRHIPTVLIPKSLNAIINIENGMKLLFTIIGENVEQPEHVEIVTYSDRSQSESDVIEKFKTCVIDNTHSGKMFLINDSMVKQNVHISSGFLQFKLKPEKLKYTLLNSESFRHCSVAARCLGDADFAGPSAPAPRPECARRDYCRSVASMEHAVRKVVSHLLFEIHREATFKGVSGIKSNVLVTGGSGAGKSALCHIVQQELSVWALVLRCRALRGRRDAPAALRRAVRRCQRRAPAVLVCDDADCLLPADLDGASPQDLAYYQRLSVDIKQILQTCSGVSVLLTARSVQALCPALRRGAFSAHARLPELRAEERLELLRHLAGPRLRARLAVRDEQLALLAAAGGGGARDLIDLLNRRVFEAVKKIRAEPGARAQLAETAAGAGAGAEARGAFDVWGPVGGLDDVKRELTEGIFWPLMYPALFPSAACGILLYGAPGTGKSLLGSCLARARGARLLVVRGPELLSRYIGQSEKAVRDVFDKADMQRPSILFFDEFDSLAPKRGHDSTGVTDRVVNQLLARLDGAEGGARGAVLAATARPDLLDPALLRPGRLARLVYCPPPDQSARLAVLRSLRAHVALGADVDLAQLAAATEGFSPADLRALLVSAQLASLEAQLRRGAGRPPRAVEVRGADVRAALAEARPSLTPAQWRFYDTIYKKFRGEKLSGEQRQLVRQMEQQRVSLA